MVVLSVELPVVPSPKHSAGLLAPDCACFQDTAYIEVVDDGLGLPASDVVGSDGAVMLDHLSVQSMVVLLAELPVVPTTTHSAGLHASDWVCFNARAYSGVDVYVDGSDSLVRPLACDVVRGGGLGLPVFAGVGSATWEPAFSRVFLRPRRTVGWIDRCGGGARYQRGERK